MKDLLHKFENKEIVFNWKDTETEAEGWTVINSLRGGAAGGRNSAKGLDMNEVLSLAKQWKLNFQFLDPIGGAKSGINFDPNDPEKRCFTSSISFIEKLLWNRW
jgi:glutamate dehydrogenase/leucine dehydrogenase